MAAPISDYSKVSLLLPMSGANNGTVFTDYSRTPKTITRSNVVTSTAQSKYYGSSAKWTAGGYLQIPHSADILFDGDFTIQWWFLMPAVPAASTYPAFVTKDTTGTTGKFLIYTQDNKGVTIEIVGSPSTWFSLGSWSAVNTWYHAAMWRIGSSLYGAVDGVVTPTPLSYSGTLGGTYDMWLGRPSNALTTRYFSGYMSDFMVCQEAIYGTENFTPPPRLIGDLNVETRDESDILVPRKYFIVPRSYSSIVKASGTTSASGVATATGLPACEYSVVAMAEGDVLPDLVLRRVAA